MRQRATSCEGIRTFKLYVYFRISYLYETFSGILTSPSRTCNHDRQLSS
jgi:hypothetical protein